MKFLRLFSILYLIWPILFSLLQITRWSAKPAYVFSYRNSIQSSIFNIFLVRNVSVHKLTSSYLSTSLNTLFLSMNSARKQIEDSHITFIWTIPILYVILSFLLIIYFTNSSSISSGSLNLVGSIRMLSVINMACSLNRTIFYGSSLVRTLTLVKSIF